MGHPYLNISVAFATMHGKERILEPLFAKEFGAKIITPTNVNTDLFGSFSGEIKRQSSVKNVLREKALLGAERTGLKFAIASEGSFGPHPWIPLMECNQESLIFMDLEKKIEIYAHFISLDNCAKYLEAENFSEIEDFLKKIDFGEQAVIVKASPDEIDTDQPIFKGLTEISEVASAFDTIKNEWGQQKVWIETDNRASMSPKRRKVIFKCAEKLIEKLNSICPGCQSPGFEMRDFVRGLVCRECELESDKPAKEIWSCPDTNCLYEELRDRADGIRDLDPSHCDWCNP